MPKTDYDNIVKKVNTSKQRNEGKARTFWIKDRDYEEFRRNCAEEGLTMGQAVVSLIKAFNKSKKS